ncbi:hypothetical protein PCASD_13446 [Puccinia coronata f. sp. avenae]|uniref:GH16 domain-containing protein n=1 Tax=Puccinia coronata f. sp. avenae TaxID=200324 RepID=A0A2N5TA88_9BASI|nr:hypothetical protein PCASD_13446 [Puccinia coronata f. sp. avenae]
MAGAHRDGSFVLIHASRYILHKFASVFFAPSRPGAVASAVVWLQTISILGGLLAPVITSHINSLLSSLHLHRHKLQESQQTSIWSHCSTISGANCFDSYVFINGWDNTTHLAAYYVDKDEAQRLSLAYVDKDARAIIGYNQTALRSSVQLESIERYDPGTLIIADFHHTPYVCASWPAFWMYGQDWPSHGEIDIFEGWNDNTRGRATLHTTPGCSHDPAGIQTGKVLQETCDTSVNYNAGCTVEDSTTDFYGPTLSNNGGAVLVAMYTNSEISIWRWRRKDVPQDIQNEVPCPKTWPSPTATWKRSNYKDVYFAINSIKIFKGMQDAISKLAPAPPGHQPVKSVPALKPSANCGDETQLT